MKSRATVKHVLKECRLNEDHLTDSDAPTKHHYINQGWVEALEWVLRDKPSLEVTPDLQVRIK